MDTDLRKFPGYTLFSPPARFAVRPPWEWSAREARKHCEWFVEQIPDRLEELRNVVATVDQKTAKSLDLTPKSLRLLGKWLEGAIETRPDDSGNADLKEAPLGMSERGLREIFTIESLSLCVDAGIYLGEVLAARFGRVHWVLCEQPRGDVSFHEPVLAGFGDKRVFDPVRETVGIARAMNRGERGPDGLHRAYRRWAETVRT